MSRRSGSGPTAHVKRCRNDAERNSGIPGYRPEKARPTRVALGAWTAAGPSEEAWPATRGAHIHGRVPPRLAAVKSYDQMYSSAIAPSRHFATVTMRPPPSNSPMTQVHSPDPKAIGWDLI